MKRLREFVEAIARDQRGQDFTEYALMAGFAASVMAVISPAMVASNGVFQHVFGPIVTLLRAAGGV